MTPKELKELRAYLGLTQVEFAKEAGYSLQAIIKMEGGRMPINPRARMIFEKIRDEE